MGLGTFVCAESSLFLFSGHVLWQILRSYMPSPLWARRAEKHSTDLLTHFCALKVKMEIKYFPYFIDALCKRRYLKD